MSQNKREGQRTARERMRAERERERAGERRMRWVKVAGSAVAVLAIAAGVGLFAANQDGGADDGGSADPVAVGKRSAPATLAIYEDFRCPACAQFERTFRDTIQELTEEGTLRTDYHLVTIIDTNMRGEGSARAANAAACARDEGRFSDYHDVLFDNQPPETEDAFADTDHLIELAGEVEGLDNPDFRSCVEGGDHDRWVDRSNAAFLDSGFQATPTVLLNGEDVYGEQSEPLTPELLKQRVAELAEDGG